MPKDGQVLSLDGLQYSSIEILFTAKIALDTRHIIHDQKLVVLLVNVTGGFGVKMFVAAKGAMLCHGSIPFRKDS